MVIYTKVCWETHKKDGKKHFKGRDPYLTRIVDDKQTGIVIITSNPLSKQNWDSETNCTKCVHVYVHGAMQFSGGILVPAACNVEHAIERPTQRGAPTKAARPWSERIHAICEATLISYLPTRRLGTLTHNLPMPSFHKRISN